MDEERQHVDSPSEEESAAPTAEEEIAETPSDDAAVGTEEPEAEAGEEPEVEAEAGEEPEVEAGEDIEEPEAEVEPGEEPEAEAEPGEEPEVEKEAETPEDASPFDVRDAHFPVFGPDAREHVTDELVELVNDGVEMGGEYALVVYDDKWAILPKDVTFDTNGECEDAVLETLDVLRSGGMLKQLNVNYFEERGLRIGMDVLPDAVHNWHIYLI